MKKIIVLFLFILFLMGCSGSIKVFNGFTVVPQSLMGLGDVYCFGVKNAPGNNGWYTLTMDSPSSRTAVLDIDGNKKKVNVNSIELDSEGNCIAITIDGKKFVLK